MSVEAIPGPAPREFLLRTPTRARWTITISGLLALAVSGYGLALSTVWFVEDGVLGLEGTPATLVVVVAMLIGVFWALLTIAFAWLCRRRTGWRHLRGLCALPSYIAVWVSGGTLNFLIGNVLVV